MSRFISLEPQSPRLRKPTETELKEYLRGLTFKQLIEDYILQTDNKDALEDLRTYIIDLILDYHIHWELYPNKIMVRK